MQAHLKKVTTSPSARIWVPSDEVDGNGEIAGTVCCVAHAPGVLEWAPHLKRASGGKGGSGEGGGGGSGLGGGGLGLGGGGGGLGGFGLGGGRGLGLGSGGGAGGLGGAG